MQVSKQNQNIVTPCIYNRNSRIVELFIIMRQDRKCFSTLWTNYKVYIASLFYVLNKTFFTTIYNVKYCLINNNDLRGFTIDRIKQETCLF